MQLTILLTLIFAIFTLDCPLLPPQQTSFFSGVIQSSIEHSNNNQDITYTQNYLSPLVELPKLVLSISSYHDQNFQNISIIVKASEIKSTSFTVQISSPHLSRWRKLDINYLCSVRSQIQLAIVSGQNFSYDQNGFFAIPYSPKRRITQKVSMKHFLTGFNIQIQKNGLLEIKFQKYQRGNTLINLVFSSKTCKVKSLTLSIVLYNPQIFGLQFTDVTLEQASPKTISSFQIEKKSFGQLLAYFVGFDSIAIRNQSNFRVSLSFNKNLSLILGSQEIKSLRITYLVISFVDCGICYQYPFLYNNQCYSKCPRGTDSQYGLCIPSSECKNGFELNQNKQCLPICGKNKIFNGKYCSCIQGYQMTKDGCIRCEQGQLFSFNNQKCEPMCEENQKFNYENQICQCISGFVLVNNQCIQCQAGTSYDPLKKQCVGLTKTSSKSQSCSQNQALVYGKCVCQKNYFRINGRCQQCPKFSIFNTDLGYCQCSSGYKRSGDKCILPCRIDQVFVDGNCQCKNGFQRSVFGDCVSQSCSQNQYYSDGKCICLTGFVRDRRNRCVVKQLTCQQNQFVFNNLCNCKPGFRRREDGLCYMIQCNQGQLLNADLGICIARCMSGQSWDESHQICITTCIPGAVYSFNSNSCVPICKNNQIWNGTACQCVSNCPIICPPGTYYNQTIGKCICPENMIWDGIKCICQNGYSNSGFCNPGCQNGQRWDVNRRTCISICLSNKIWNGFRCTCQVGSYQLNGYCISNCGNFERNINGKCQCIENYYRINGVCSICPQNYIWDSNYNNCIPNNQPYKCFNGKIWNGFLCVCPNGFKQIGSTCQRNFCNNNQIQLPSGQCVCQQGYKLNNQGSCQITCPRGYVMQNGECKQTCGRGEQWSGYSCVCKQNFERMRDGLCLPICPVGQRRKNINCECIDGYQRGPSGKCENLNNNCPFPHNLIGLNCFCATGFQKNNQGICVQICKPGFYRNQNGYCILKCDNDQILVDGQCKCRVGLNNINGKCSLCPQNSVQTINGGCICVANNLPVIGNVCPPPGCLGSDRSSVMCRCTPPAVWIYGNCQRPRVCNQNQIWTGYDCVCNYGYKKIGEICQRVNQRVQCPSYSIFNGVSCLCLLGYYPQNNQCIKCPFGTFWNGRSCIKTRGSCENRYVWDSFRSACRIKHSCKQNQEWDGVNCRCSIGFYWIDGMCNQCPFGTYFDGRQCSRGDNNDRCRDPYSYYNGALCVCIPGYWMFQNRCITCPPSYQWNGICCSSRGGFTFSLSESNDGETVSPRFLKA